MLTAGCLFSGMGGFASGLGAAGFKILWANDNDPFACQTFRHRFPDVKVVEQDVNALSVEGDSLAPVDVLAAGFPCQSFSQAGDRRGFDDPRGKTFSMIPEIIAGYPLEDRPKLVILENVPHLQHGADGLWFQQVQRELRQAGYWFRAESCWTANVKDVTAIPQDRERLFMVAASREYFSHNPFRPNLLPSRSNHRMKLDDIIDRTSKADDAAYLDEDNRYCKQISATMNEGMSDRNIFQLRRSYVREKKEGLCPTLTANMGIGGNNVPFIRYDWGIRKLSIQEVARFQGFTDSESLFPDITEAEQYRLLGNAACVELARIVGEECSEILRARGRNE